MKIHFYLRFHSKPGQSLAISGDHSLLGNGEHGKALPMSYHNNDYWHVEVELDAASHSQLLYKYILINEDGFRVLEWGEDRCLDLSKAGLEEIQVMDMWNHAGEYENAFYTDPFQQILLEDSTLPSTSHLLY